MPDDDDRTLTDLSHSSDSPADDTDLIAYLDGELDADAAVRVEARLARDPAARTAAEAYKKSYDLLDYLPTAEPKPDLRWNSQALACRRVRRPSSDTRTSQPGRRASSSSARASVAPV